MNKLKDAAGKSMEKWMETIPDDIPEAEFSPEHEKEMKKIFASAKKKKIAAKTVARIALAAALTVALAVVCVYGDTGVNEYTLTVQYDTYFKNVIYTVDDPYDGKVKEGVTVGYMPENFILTEDWINEDRYAQKVYKDPSNNYNNLGIAKQPSSAEICLGGQKHFEENCHIVSKGNFDYIVDYSEEYTLIVWNNETYIYSIHATNCGLTEDELLKIAYSVK